MGTARCAPPRASRSAVAKTETVGWQLDNQESFLVLLIIVKYAQIFANCIGAKNTATDRPQWSLMATAVQRAEMAAVECPGP